MTDAEEKQSGDDDGRMGYHKGKRFKPCPDINELRALQRGVQEDAPPFQPNPRRRKVKSMATFMANPPATPARTVFPSVCSFTKSPGSYIFQIGHVMTIELCPYYPAG